MRMRVMFIGVSVRGDVMSNIFVYRSDMLAGLVSRSISRRRQPRIVWR
jgi:hypothetical protein